MNADELLSRFEERGRVALTTGDFEFVEAVSAVLDGITKCYWGVNVLHRASHDSARSADMILITSLLRPGNRRLQELSPAGWSLAHASQVARTS
jgi:hypothetical protein